jgi:ribosomal protein L25 (general stress protein Ctc)
MIDLRDKESKMVDFNVEVFERSKGGSAECRRLRGQGKVPSVIYGHNQPSLNVAVDAL